MRSVSRIAVGVLLAVFGLANVALADTKENIVEVLIKAGPFKTFCKALIAADLTDALQNPGPFTVFAPTDTAFAKLEKEKPGTLASLMKPANKGKLVALLTYHALKGKYYSADAKKLFDGSHVKTVNGKAITIHNTHGLYIDNAKVINQDLECRNGVVHVLDTVLIPR